MRTRRCVACKRDISHWVHYVVMRSKQCRFCSDLAFAASDLGPLCLLRPVFPNTYSTHGNLIKPNPSEIILDPPLTLNSDAESNHKWAAPFINGFSGFLEPWRSRPAGYLFILDIGHLNSCPAEYIKKPRPFLIFSQSDYLIKVVDPDSHT